ncbi:MAG: 2Fe-2S iron-sulfur cluster-binding protein [Hyphomicrobiaceae bacterium]
MSGTGRGAIRLDEGGEIDRGRPISFRFDGMPLQGYAGDTIASALLANGLRTVARSFKYHRPRGILGYGVEEPSAILDLRVGEGPAARHDPNARATIEPLLEGMVLKAVHAAGTAARDRLAVLDRFHRFIPSAFYYKTFIWPSWHAYEARIRAMAGLGRIDPDARAGVVPHRFANVDLLVVGSGPAGLAAALAGLAGGRTVMLIEQDARIGGSLRMRAGVIDGRPGAAWAEETVRKLVDGGAAVRTSATAIALYDHNLVAVHERGHAPGGAGDCLWRVRAREIVLAAGAIERPLLFADNDRPGVMLASAALAYLRRKAVRAGGKIVVATASDAAYELAGAMAAAGAEVVVADARKTVTDGARALAGDVTVHAGERIRRALGRSEVAGVELTGGTRIDADLLAVSGGFSPAIHLYAHAKGRPRWDGSLGAFVPGEPVPGLRVAGAAAGRFALADALEDGTRAGRGSGEAAPAPSAGPRAVAAAALQHAAPIAVPEAAARDRVFVDLQNDVITKDIALAARESFKAVEHLKRYTTLGMATDQGKTSNVNGLAVLASITGRSIAETGVTTFRPPYAPVPFAAIIGPALGELDAPVRRLPAENEHRAEQAVFDEYGGILRPAWYGSGPDAIASECRAARTAVTVFDASPLGKVEVVGPDAAALLDFVFYTRMSTLKPGRLRYGLMLSEGGVVFDDGVVLRLAPDRFVVSCSSSHVPAVVGLLEEWRQDRFDIARVFVHDTTGHWATMAIAGPGSRAVVAAIFGESGLDDVNLPHMAMREARFEDGPARISRVSFVGERSYEISVPAGRAVALWRAARKAGAVPLGVEALSILRLEKGFIMVGVDTDGETMPHDIGMGRARDTRTDAYAGDRSLFTAEARKPHRKQLVGIAIEGAARVPVGAHAVVREDGRRRSIGFVTSSAISPTLGSSIALARIEDGERRHGESVTFDHLGRIFTGRIVAPCFYDQKGERLHA